jgi:protocatechuate 3,4-dioxygenase beta subunit
MGESSYTLSWSKQSQACVAACSDDDETWAQTDGPFFTPNSPKRMSLREPAIAGEQMTLSGLVLSTACRPIAGALLDFWHADDAGEYDNSGFRLRGASLRATTAAFGWRRSRRGCTPAARGTST